MFACFCQVSLFPPPCPSHSAVTRWAPARSLFCSASSFCCPVLSVQTRGHPAVADHQDSCGAAFPLQCCCWLGAGWGCVVPGVTVGLCEPCEGRPGLPRAQRGCAADGTVVFPMSYCRGFVSSALGRVSGDRAGIGPASGSLGKPSTPSWAPLRGAELGVRALLTQEEPCLSSW